MEMSTAINDCPELDVDSRFIQKKGKKTTRRLKLTNPHRSEDIPASSELGTDPYELGENNFSQILNLTLPSQGSLQNGRFTYHQSRYVFNLRPENRQDSEDLSIDRTTMALSYISGVQNLRKFPDLVIKSVINAEIHFQYPMQYVIKFLKQFLNMYSEPDLKSINDSSLLFQYVKFVQELFMDKLSKHPKNKWTRSNVISLLESGKTDNPTENDLYLFDLMEFIPKCFNEIPKSKQARYTQFLSSSLLTIIVNFLVKDFEIFFAESDDYYNDILDIESDQNQKPILVRMLWPKTMTPNYMSSTVKIFISNMIKILQSKDSIGMTNFETCRLYDKLCSDLFQLMALTTECLRIGSGNTRPYLSIHSSRILMAYELWWRLSRVKLSDNFEFLLNIVGQIRMSPILCMQFCLHILNDRYTDLKCVLRTVIGEKILKSKLSLRMIVCTFLTGNLEEFTAFHLKMIRKNQQREEDEEMTETTNEQLEKISNQLKLKKDYLLNNSKKIPENFYTSFLVQKTIYGGNALHIACRNNDPDAVMRLFKMTKPNQADHFGFTPLIDAVRFGHRECVRAMIDASKKFEIPLYYDVAVAKENGFTALHYAILNKDIEIICLLLKNGDRTLLYRQSIDGKIPEDLIGDNDDEIRKAIDSTEYKPYENILPEFEKLSQDWKMELRENIYYYCRFVQILIESYLAAIRFYRLEFKYDICDESIDQLRIFLRDVLFEPANQEFERKLTEEQLDYLMDDLEVLAGLEGHIQKFFQHLKNDQNIDLLDEMDVFFEFNFQYSKNWEYIRKIFA